MIAKISKTYSFDAAHQLTGHNGKCANLHGHTYTVKVWLKGEVIRMPGHSSDGMLLDYARLDDLVKPLIEGFDHAFITNLSEPVWQALMVDENKGFDAVGRFWDIGMRTTAENIATWIATILQNDLKTYNNIQLVGVCVSETPKTEAEVILEVKHER